MGPARSGSSPAAAGVALATCIEIVALPETRCFYLDEVTQPSRRCAYCYGMDRARMLRDQAKLLRDIAKSAQQDPELHDLLHKLARECEDLADGRARSLEPSDLKVDAGRSSAASAKRG